MKQLVLALDNHLVITVHCCFCLHAETRTGTLAAHDAMEAHYAAKHGRFIDSIVVGRWKPGSL